jgi:hypothetical protein
MTDTWCQRGSSGASWVFLRAVAPGSPRAAAYHRITQDGFLLLPFEVIHAPGFAIYATPAMQRRLELILTKRRKPQRAFLHAPGISFGCDGIGKPFDRYMDTLPPPLRIQLKKVPPVSLAESDGGPNIVLLSPSNKFVGTSSFGVFFRVEVYKAALEQSSSALLALMVGLIASAFHDPEWMWFRDKVKGDAALDRVLPRWADVRDRFSESSVRLRQTVLYLAMLDALPSILRSLPDSDDLDLVPHACHLLADEVVAKLFPTIEDDLVDLRRIPRGNREVFTPELLAWPGSKSELVFDRVGRPQRNRRLGALHRLARARLTPDQMSAVMAKSWGIAPLDGADAKRRKVHLSRARKRLRNVPDEGDL